jgi:hypothetical protein
MAESPANEAFRDVYFRDSRPPHQIQAHFEGVLGTLFRPEFQGSKLVFRAAAKLTGCPYGLELRFDAALPNQNCYTLKIHASWANLPPDSHAFFRNSFEHWVTYWTKPLQIASAPEDDEGSTERYRALAEQTLAMEAQLSTVAAVQDALLAQMRKGATFSTAHKEGGTILRWQGSHFTRTDFGESDLKQTFDDDSTFLTFVHAFYDWDTSSHVYPNKVSELDAWKLILRKLSP